MKIYGFTSGKGGVGKSTLVANLGIALARYKQRTLVVDADIPMPDLGGMLGVSEPPITLCEVLAKSKKIQQAIYKGPSNLDVIPSSSALDSFLQADVRLLKNVILSIKDQYDFILVDTPSGLNNYVLGALKSVDEIFLVVTPDEPSVSNALKLKTALEVLDIKTKGVILNRVRKKRFGKMPQFGKAEVEMRLGSNVVSIVPEDEEITKSLGLRKPLMARKPDSNAAKALRILAKNLIREVAPTPVVEPKKVKKEVPSEIVEPEKGEKEGMWYWQRKKS